MISVSPSSMAGRGRFIGAMVEREGERPAVAT